MSAKVTFEGNGNRNVRSGGGSDGGLTFEHDDTVGKVGGHDEVVLDDKGRLFRVEDEATKALSARVIGKKTLARTA